MDRFDVGVKDVGGAMAFAVTAAAAAVTLGACLAAATTEAGGVPSQVSISSLLSLLVSVEPDALKILDSLLTLLVPVAILLLPLWLVNAGTAHMVSFQGEEVLVLSVGAVAISDVAAVVLPKVDFTSTAEESIKDGILISVFTLKFLPLLLLMFKFMLLLLLLLLWPLLTLFILLRLLLLLFTTLLLLLVLALALLLMLSIEAALIGVTRILLPLLLSLRLLVSL